MKQINIVVKNISNINAILLQEKRVQQMYFMIATLTAVKMHSKCTIDKIHKVIRLWRRENVVSFIYIASQTSF